MLITPESIRLFTLNARLALQAANIPPRHVLLRRLAIRRTSWPAGRRQLSIDTSSSPAAPAVDLPPSKSPSVSPVEAESWTAADSTEHRSPPTVENLITTSKPLPQSCPGCGALSQEVEPGEAGYYSRTRRAVKGFFRSMANHDSEKEALHRGIRHHTLIDSTRHTKNLYSGQGEINLGTDDGSSLQEASLPSVPIPFCDRCHDLLYQSRGVSIAHPPIDAIADSIAESPFRHNHVFHILDAADFPLSLIPNLHRSLNLAKPRSQNRRSQHDFSRKPTLSFIITRADLVARTKEGSDRLMPYFTAVLRTALGSFGEDIRLGNVHLVSAKRGWWTRDIKDSIWKRGGGNWMVGKANVGKSNLFEVLFPKGSDERAPSYAELQQSTRKAVPPLYNFQNDKELPEGSLLPPLQPETPFPVLPLVSSLPGTTASPIRLSFGNHKGELIDLPGLTRGDLEDYVQPEHKGDLIMETRPTVSQHNIKTGQSLLLGGGLVRITPSLDESDPSTIVLAYAFVPVEAHVTATSKAVGTQLQERESGIKSMLADGAGSKMASAGVFSLNDDVTKARAGPLLASGVSADKLPFRVFATDILIEGVGWVELVCQVRRRRQRVQSVVPSGPDSDALSNKEKPPTSQAVDPSGAFDFPQVEIFTPEGKHVGQRTTMQAWRLWQDAHRSVQRKKSVTARPRKPMKGAKRREKEAMRAAL